MQQGNCHSFETSLTGADVLLSLGISGTTFTLHGMTIMVITLKPYTKNGIEAVMYAIDRNGIVVPTDNPVRIVNPPLYEFMSHKEAKSLAHTILWRAIVTTAHWFGRQE